MVIGKVTHKKMGKWFEYTKVDDLTHLTITLFHFGIEFKRLGIQHELTFGWW